PPGHRCADRGHWQDRGVPGPSARLTGYSVTMVRCRRGRPRPGRSGHRPASRPGCPPRRPSGGQLRVGHHLLGRATMAAMSSLPSELNARVEAVAGIDPELRAATKPQFGHFQSNVALRLAKSEGRPPREIAQLIVDRLDVSD